jgi:hypothetical protein
MRQYFSAMLLGAVLCAPAMIQAQDRDRVETKKYYDPYKKDYHEWNDAEQRSWEHWLRDEHHKEVYGFTKASKADQREYWRWRHDHPDSH